MTTRPATRVIHTEEHPGIPMLSLVLGFGPAFCLAAGALCSLLAPASAQGPIAMTTDVVAGSILAFLAGVRRGVSFRTEGGPRASQIVTMLAIYGLAFFSLLATTTGWLRVASAIAALGFAALMILDPMAARYGEVPWFFRRLRPSQMLIASLSLLALAVALRPHP